MPTELSSEIVCLVEYYEASKVNKKTRKRRYTLAAQAADGLLAELSRAAEESEREARQQAALRHRIATEDDFIAIRKYDHSCKRMCLKNPEGVSDKMIAQVLLIDESSIESLYQQAVHKLRRAMGL